MKKTQEILGLPIISISDGMEVGKVKSLIINADKGAIDYVVVDSGIQILSARVIGTDTVLGVGEYALTIENDSSINDISKIPPAIDLLQKNIQVKGTKVLTKKGRLIGEIGDIYVDEDECFKIIGLEYIADITQKRIRIIPRESVITFGKNLVVVTEDVENTLLDKANQLGTGNRFSDDEKKNTVNFDLNNKSTPPTYPSEDEAESAKSSLNEADKIMAATTKEYFKGFDASDFKKPKIDYEEDKAAKPDYQEPVINIIKEDTSPTFTFNTVESEIPQPVGEEELPATAGPFQGSDSSKKKGTQSVPSPATEGNAASLFEQRQKQYLNGRRATKTISDNAGNEIIGEGAVITNDVIDIAKQSGKLIELVMNNKA